MSFAYTDLKNKIMFLLRNLEGFMQAQLLSVGFSVHVHIGLYNFLKYHIAWQATCELKSWPSALLIDWLLWSCL